MANAKQGGGGSVSSAGKTAEEFRRRFEELSQLKNSIKSSDDFAKRFAALQRLRNEALDIRRILPSDSTSPSVNDLNSLSNFAQDSLHALAREGRGQQSGKPTKVESGPSAIDTGSPGIFRHHSSFYQPHDSINGGDGSRGESGQSRILEQMKEIVEKSTLDLSGRMEQLELNVHKRLDRFENRLDNSDGNIRSAQVRMDESISHLQRGIGRVEDQYNVLSRRLDAMEDRQNRKIDDLLQRQQVVTALPHVVHVNFSGQVPRVEGAAVVLPSTSYSAPSPVKPEPSTNSSNFDQNPSFVTRPSSGFLDFGSPVDLSSSQSVPPPSVNVPKKGSVEPLTSAQICTPSSKGVATVSWGAPAKPSVSLPNVSGQQSGIFSTNVPKENPKTVVNPSESVNVADIPKSGPFAGFQGLNLSTSQKLVETSGSFSGTLFPSQGVNSFGQLANIGSPVVGFQADPKGFPGSGQKLFGVAQKGTPTVVRDDDNEEEEDGGNADYEPNVSFKPLVSLPEVDIETGEEDYEIVFSDRAKLFRFDTATKEWKERGLGDITVQRRKDGLARVLMRREKIHKICANHVITQELKLERKSEAEKNVWKWFANDFSDGEVKLECFCVRFKKTEQADAFKAAIENIQNEALEKKSSSSKAPAPLQSSSVAQKPAQSLSELFKPSTGSWNCDACYVNNNADKTQCLACGSPKPGRQAASLAANPFDTKSAAGESATGLFKPSFVPSQNTSGFSFGFAPTAPTIATQGATAVKPSTFEGLFSASPGIAAGSEFAASTPLKSLFGAPGNGCALGFGGFNFLSTPSNGFTFDMTAKPNSASKKNEDEHENGEDAGDVEAERSDLYFEPLVKLPEKVDLVTGEENETELYSQRAKLYRYTEKEWKERGIGDMKMMMMKEINSNKIRLLMRREKILKVCCNHNISGDMELRPMPGTKNAWVWDALDYSEGVSEHETLALRFKHQAHATEFKELFERCKAIVSAKSGDKVEKFERVQVDENESLKPIMAGGEKAVADMATTDPLLSGKEDADATSVRNADPEDGDRETAEGAVDLQRREHLVGDKVYDNFGIIYNARVEIDAIFCALGFLRLKLAENLQLLIQADSMPAEEFQDYAKTLTEPIELKDYDNVPESVLRYVRSMEVKELGDDEAWRTPLFERHVQLFKRLKETSDSPWESLGNGRLRISRQEEEFLPFYIQFTDPCEDPLEHEPELAIHHIAADADLKVDLVRKSARWGANDQVNQSMEKAQFRVTFSDHQSLDDFERAFKKGVEVAEGAGVLNSDPL